VIQKLIVNDSRGGTGKSQEIIRLVINGKEQPTLYLAFNKFLRQKFQGDLKGFDEVKVHTIHSLCHKILHDLDVLPEGFRDVIDLANKEGLVEQDYKALITDFLLLKDKEIQSAIGELDNIYLDEYQDLSEELLKVVKRLVEIFDIKLLYIAGDKFQSIYNSKNKSNKSTYLECIPKYFGKEIDEIVSLKINYRVINRKLQETQNRFILNEGNSEADTTKCSRSVYSAKPIFRICNHQEKELEFVEKTIKLHCRNKDVVILSAHKADLEIYKKHQKDLSESVKNLKISTIHSYKGLGSEIVFIVAFQFRDEMNNERGIKQFNINYVGISRAKQKLFMSSSYPMNRNDVLEAFGNSVDIFDLQGVERWKEYKKLRQPKELKSSIINRLNISNIDSIKFRVMGKNVPYFAYFKSNQVKDRNNSIHRFKRNRIVEFRGLTVRISFHYAHKTYYFEFYDLNLLKKNGYTDLEIILFCRNFIRQFFDYRISDDRIDLFRIDLCKLYTMKEFENKCIAFGEDELKVISIVDESGIIVSDIACSVKAGHSVYINFHKKRLHSIAIYLPVKKMNSNRIPNRDIFKIEHRFYTPEIVGRNYALGSLKLTDLIIKLKNNKDYLEDIPKQALKHKMK